MQPLNPNDYERELRAVEHAKMAIRVAIGAVAHSVKICATAQSLERYSELVGLLQDAHGDLDGLETEIGEAAQVQPASFYRVA